MVDGESVAKGRAQSLDELLGDGKFGYEVEDRASLRENFGRQVDVEFGLAAGCDAVEQGGTIARERIPHLRESLALERGECGCASECRNVV